MPTNRDGVHIFKDAKIMFAPGKAANAGGVAVLGLEMSQNSGRRAWSAGELQQMLKDIMDGIHRSCLTYGGQGNGYIAYVKGANLAGFKQVADAMLAFGVVSFGRSAAPRVGTECVRPCRFRWSPFYLKKYSPT